MNAERRPNLVACTVPANDGQPLESTACLADYAEDGGMDRSNDSLDKWSRKVIHMPQEG